MTTLVRSLALGTLVPKQRRTMALYTCIVLHQCKSEVPLSSGKLSRKANGYQVPLSGWKTTVFVPQNLLELKESRDKAAGKMVDPLFFFARTSAVMDPLITHVAKLGDIV